MNHATDPIIGEPSKKFRVALSFSGRQRDTVRKIAEILRQRFGDKNVFIDEDYAEEIGRFDLGLYLHNVYGRDSELVVVFHGAGYTQGDWCRAEWKVIRGLAMNRGDDIMLMRLDNSPLPDGVDSVDHFLDVAEKTPKEIANYIVGKYLKIASEGNPPAVSPNDPRLHYVVLKLPLAISRFNQRTRIVLFDTITLLAQSDEDLASLHLMVIEPGSVRLHLKMSESLAIEVCQAARSGHLGQFPVIFWKVEDPSFKVKKALGPTHGWSQPHNQKGAYWGPERTWLSLMDAAAEIIPDTFVLINIISKRVQQLNNGRPPLIPTRPSMGAGQIALMELIEGKIRRVSDRH